MERPVITLTEEMFASARQKAGLAHVNRTSACRPVSGAPRVRLRLREAHRLA